ncbi:hypothetical protein SERLA73DRAFT_27349, partial [Serpula lacrymans var. lacrymans S7.3]
QHQQKVEIAQKIIYKCNYTVNSRFVENLLKEESLVPTLNTFSTTLTPLGINFFSLFVIDILHEIELSVWKLIFIHLLCMLDTLGGNVVNELDHLYREIPSFGRDTIRHFSANSSELKKLAARDYKNFLQ